MVKSVKRCLHWHVISRLIYNSIIDTINLSAGPETPRWVSYRGGSTRTSGLGPACGKLGLPSRRPSEGPGAARLCWSGAGRQQVHGSPLPPDSGFLIFLLTCVCLMPIHSPVWFLLKQNKTKQQNLTQENSVHLWPQAYSSSCNRWQMFLNFIFKKWHFHIFCKM